MTMRFEAEYQYFKHLATSMGNYVNVPHSLAMRHQCYQCYNLQDPDMLCGTQETGPGKFNLLSDFNILPWSTDLN